MIQPARPVKLAAEDTRRNSSVPWFVRPSTLLAVGLFLAVVPALFSSSVQHGRWGTAWYVSASDYIGVIGSGLVVALGLRTMRGRSRRLDERIAIMARSTDRLDRACNWLLFLLTVGYVVWSISALRHGLTLRTALDVFSGQNGANYEARDSLVTVPGVSTLTEVGPALLAALVVLWRLGRRRPLAVAYVLALATVRAFLNSERLSLIEVVIPVVIAVGLLVNTTDDPKVRRTRRRIALVSVMLPLAVLGFFMATERNRSWSHYESEYSGSLLNFSVDRMWAYYATGLNNGVVYKRFYAPTLPYPVQTILPITNAPLVGEVVKSMGLADPPAWSDALASYASPEYNNQSGFLPIIGEVGIIPAGVIFLGWGVGLGALYRRGLQGSAAALSGYAALAVGMIEVGRYPYYLSGRMVPGLIAIFILARAQRPDSEADAHPKPSPLIDQSLGGVHDR